MKILLKILLSLFLLLCMLWSACIVAVPLFLREMISLHGAAISGTAVESGLPVIDWQGRRLTWSHWQLDPVVIDNIDLQLSPEFIPDWRQAGLLPSPLAIDALVLDGIVLDYDVDSEAADLRSLRMQVANAASSSLRDRLNAASGATVSPQLFVIRNMHLGHIVVQARSNNPGKAKKILIADMDFDSLGTSERGVSAAEIASKVVRGLLDEVQRQAEIQGIVEIRKPAEVHRPDATQDTSRDGGEVNDGSRAKKTAEAVGRGLREFGHDIGQGVKKLFK